MMTRRPLHLVGLMPEPDRRVPFSLLMRRGAYHTALRRALWGLRHLGGVSPMARKLYVRLAVEALRALGWERKFLPGAFHQWPLNRQREFLLRLQWRLLGRWWEGHYEPWAV